MTPETKQQVLALIDEDTVRWRHIFVSPVPELLETLTHIRNLIDPPRDLEAELEAAKEEIEMLKASLRSFSGKALS